MEGEVGHERTTPWIKRSPVLASSLAILAAVCGMACGGTTGTEGEDLASTNQAIIGGSVDDATANDAVVALRIGTTSPYELCTGALIAPNVVLTARHCVSESISKTVVCNDKGESTNGAHVGADHDPSTIQIYTGSNPAFAGEPSAHVRAIFHPEGNILCDRDVALVVLDKNLDDITPMAVRIDGGVQEGESVRSIGYGKNDVGLSTGTRIRKDAVDVLAVGAGVSKSQTSLGAHEFEVGMSICQGDSGGPAISETTGAVVGVVSRGGECNEDFGHIYVQTTGFQKVFADAFAEAGATPQPETGAPPAAAKPSTKPAQADGDQGSAATPARGQAAGCSAAPTGTSTDATFVLAIALAATLIRRRRSAS